MTPPRVTVVIPTFNSAGSVSRTILSVLHQTMEHFELIVVDDGSTDDFDGAIAPYMNDERIRVIHQANAGLAASRNRGIAEAQAPLVAPIDADDLWHPEFLEETVSALALNPEAPFAYSYCFRMDEKDFMLPGVAFDTPPRHDFRGLLSLNSVACGSAAVFRRDLMLQCGGYDEEMTHQGIHGAEDWKLILRLARLGEPMLIERGLVGYRLVRTGMSQGDPRRQFRAVLAVIEGVRQEVPDLPRRALADARTMMTAWLMPAFARNRLFGMFLFEGFRAYVLNPLWFTNPLLRRIHYVRAILAWRSLRDMMLGRKPEHPHLSEIVFDGKYAFAYLPKVTGRHAQRHAGSP